MSTKLQNGDGGKDGAASAASSEEKKKAKSRFMFNIADGGFTGTDVLLNSSWTLRKSCVVFDPCRNWELVPG